MEIETINQLLQPVLSVVFLMYVVILVVVSLVLRYHWKNYGVEKEKVEQIQFWYFSVAGFFACTMAIALIFIITS